MLKKGIQPLWACVLFLCLSVFSIYAQAENAQAEKIQAENAQIIQQVADSGAPGLAMFMLDKQQAKLKSDSAHFFVYEQQRQQIIIKWQLWQQGLTRLQSLPSKIPPKFKPWVNSLKIRYLIELKQYQQALSHLRKLIWNSQQQNSQQLALWQKLVIRTYVASNQISNAEKAMLRYQQDYKDQSYQWKRLQAEILLLSDRAEEVVELLSGRYEEQFEVYKLLGKLHQANSNKNKIYAKAVEKAQSEHLPPNLQAQYWFIAAQAAKQVGSAVRQALSLDKIAQLNQPLDARLFPFTGDQLWQSYLKNGQYIGNKEQLILGDDENWFKLVEQSLPNYHIRAKSLLTVVAFTTTNLKNRKIAMNKLIKLIHSEDNGMNILKTLFLQSKRFENTNTIAHQARYLLVDDALENNQIPQASKLISQLAPPEGEDAFKWELRRARVLIMGANYQEGADILSKLIGQKIKLTSQQLDKITQVLFDLQSVEQHQKSIQLFKQLLSLPLDSQRKREILFWQAQSYSHLKQYKNAALQYLKSAYLLNQHGADPWAKTARYNAAEALANAGLIDDAKRAYQQLLTITTNKKRRSVIQSHLKGLWLKPKK